MATNLPTDPGFYWWRKTTLREWRLVQVIDLGAGRLMSFDIECSSFKDRPIEDWEEFEVIGHWQKITKPGAP